MTLPRSPAGSSACARRVNRLATPPGLDGQPRDAEIPRLPLTSAAERAVDGDHRRAARVDGVDDLGVVDALQIDRGDAEVGVAELALDDDQRQALAGHLDGVRVAQLVRREASPYAGLAGDAS